MKDKKEIFKLIGIILGGLAIFVLSIIGIVNIANKSHKDDNVPVVQVEQENGIRLRQNKVNQNSNTTSLTAVINPSNAFDTTVSWTIAWASSNSNLVNDFVNLEVDSDTTLSCDITVLKAFSTRIIVTCTSNMDTTKTATCTLDYVSRKFADTCETPGLLNRSSASACTDKCTSYASNIAYYLSLGSLTGGTINGKIQDLTLTRVKLNNIDVSEYLITNPGNYTVNDMIQYLINNGTNLSQFSSLYLRVEFTYKVYFDYSQYGGNSEQTNYFVTNSSGALDKTINIDSSAFQVNSVSLDNEIIF